MSDSNKLVLSKIIVKDSPENEHIPLDCPICNLSFRDMNDIISYETHQCCTDCAQQFVFKDREAWASGVRPEKEEIEKFKQYLKKRPSYLL